MPEKDMLINYVPGEECRIAITEDGKLEELYTERARDELHVSNIYRGRVTNVEPSIQAAFVDFGIDRNGFLHISDLHPRYFPGGKGSSERTERVGKKTPRRDRPPIQACLKRGQEILVQVLKEGIGTKGPTLTSYLSIPGRFLVMMPQMERHGVSRKVEDDDARREMRQILADLNPPEGFGFIVRTAGIGRTKTELKRDLAYLLRLWKTIDRRMKQGSGPAELYTESDLVIRTIRDVLSNDVGHIIVDHRGAAIRARDFLRIAMPRTSTRVMLYDKPVPLFDAFDIERQIETVNSRSVPLDNGGSLVIDQTEAMVAIDVNSGKFRDNRDAESTAYQTNIQAVDEIARQLRLRDLGGVVVLDLIDMYVSKHRRDIERRFRDNLKKDRARTKVLRINEFGLMSLTRQRMRPSLRTSLHETCPTCAGSGHIRTPDSIIIDVMRRLAVILDSPSVRRVELTVHPQIVSALVNRKKHSLVQLEDAMSRTIHLHTNRQIGLDQFDIVAYDQRGIQLDLDSLPRSVQPGYGDCQDVTQMQPPPEEEQDREVDAGAESKEQASERSTTDSKSTEEVKQSDAADDSDENGTRKRRKRRRRGGRKHRSKKSDTAPSPTTADEKQQSSGRSEKQERGKESPEPDEKSQPVATETKTEKSASDTGDGDESSSEGKPTTRRRRRGGRRRRRSGSGDKSEATQQSEGEAKAADEAKGEGASKEKAADTKAAREQKEPEQPAQSSADESSGEGESSTPAKKTKRRRRTTKRKTTKAASAS